MSKSLGNSIALSASPGEIREAVRKMYTDPRHVRASDPGQVEGNVVFTYLDAFAEDQAEVEELKARYRAGGLGDVKVKKRLEDILQALLAPVRERRHRLAQDQSHVLAELRKGTERAKEVTQATLDEVKAGLGLFSF